MKPVDLKPGSSEAKKVGCTCPVLDNAYGLGRGGDGDRFGWVIFGNCPIHRQELDTIESSPAVEDNDPIPKSADGREIPLHAGTKWVFSGKWFCSYIDPDYTDPYVSPWSAAAEYVANNPTAFSILDELASQGLSPRKKVTVNRDTKGEVIEVCAWWYESTWILERDKSSSLKTAELDALKKSIPNLWTLQFEDGELKIFNRYGEIVISYEHDIESGWEWSTRNLSTADSIWAGRLVIACDRFGIDLVVEVLK